MASLFDKAKEFVAEKIAGVPKPEASLAAVSIKSFSRDSLLFHSDVAVHNPYSHPIPICEVSFSLKSAGRCSLIFYRNLESIFRSYSDFYFIFD